MGGDGGGGWMVMGDSCGWRGGGRLGGDGELLWVVLGEGVGGGDGW